MYGANRASSISVNVTTTMVVLSELGATFSELSCIRTTPVYELVTFILVKCDITNSIMRALYCSTNSEVNSGVSLGSSKSILYFYFIINHPYFPFLIHCTDMGQG